MSEKDRETGTIDPTVGRTPGPPDPSASLGYRLLLEMAPAGMLLVVAGGTILEANPAACRLLERGRHEVLAGGLREVFDDSDPRLERAVRRQRATGSFRGRLALLRGDGSSLPVEASLEGYREGNGEIIAVSFWEAPGRAAELQEAAVRLEKARQKLEAGERRFRVTFEAAAVGMAHVAPDGRWLRVNDKLCEIVGYPRQELLELTFQDITHPDDLQGDLEHVRRMIGGEIRAYKMEKRYLRKDGSRVWILLTVSLIREPSGEPECFISVVENITGRKLKELVPDALTPKETEVLRLIAQGRTNAEIARTLNYSLGSVKLHVQRVIAKLGVENRARAAARAVEVGLIVPQRR